jgi:hypothetical protein
LDGSDAASAPKASDFLTAAEAAQLAADMKLAEELQEKEYAHAEYGGRSGAGTPTRATTPSHANQSVKSSSTTEGQSWMEWLGITSPSNTAPAATSPTPAFAMRSSNSTEAVDGASNSAYTPPLSAAQNVARIAERQPLFACVADSLTQTATQFSQALTLSDSRDFGSEDCDAFAGSNRDTDYHGVDATSLLAMPDEHVGRNSSKK